jgi:CheY-like chemotaxis protein
MPCEILLVEDSLFARQSIARYLRNSGSSVEEAADGESALERIAGKMFRIVITDLHLSGKINGLEVMNRQKQVSADRRIKVASLGASYFDKPLWLPDLLTEVERLCARS